MGVITDILDEKDMSLHLPARASLAILGHTCRSIPEIPVEYAALVFYTKVAEVMALSRARVFARGVVSDSSKGVFTNLYSLLFLSSGIGKDRVSSLVGNVYMADVKKMFSQHYKSARDEKIKGLAQTAAELYPDKKRQHEFMRVHEPHTFVFTAARGTPQGIYAYRKTLAEIGMGGFTFQSSEFADYFISKDETHKAVLDVLKEGYEGDTESTILKGEKTVEASYGVPMNVLAHTVNTDWKQDTNSKNQLLEFFSRGWSRRSYICITDTNIVEVPTDIRASMIERQKLQEELSSILPEIQGDFSQLYHHTSKIAGGVIYNLTDEAVVLYMEYEAYIQRILNNKKDNSNYATTTPYVIGETKGRPWKALKLAAIMAAYEHPGEYIVDADAVRAAIAWTEYFGSNFLKFFSKIIELDYETLNEYFLARPGQWITKTQVRDARIVGVNRFSQWFKESIEALQEKLEDDGQYTLEEQQHGSRGTKYKLIKTPATVTKPNQLFSK